MNKNSKENRSKNYKVIMHIPIHLNDAISAIDVYDDMILLGTLMGYVKICYINKIFKDNKTKNTISSNLLTYPQVIDVMELASENISCVSFENRDTISFSIGDFEIYHISIAADSNNNSNIIKNKNYPNESEHIKYCETCMCYMTADNFFKINTEFAESNEPIKMKKFKYELKTLTTFEVILGEIEMTNYSVPFDFDGEKFIWIDYFSPIERKLCIFYPKTKHSPLVIPISKDFTHISHIKLLPNNRVFIVIDNNQCEIRLLTSTFELTNKFTHIGDEVIATAVYISGTKVSEEFNDDICSSVNNLNFNSYDNRNDLYLKLNRYESLHRKNNSNEEGELPVRFSRENESCHLGQTIRSNYPNNNSMKCFQNNADKQTDTIFIATLDYEGNFNIYDNTREYILFNLYQIEGISMEIKEKEFFSSGFPYYITFNNLFYVISTDQGAFVIEKK